MDEVESAGTATIEVKTVEDVRRLAVEGEIAQAQVAIEHWRANGEWASIRELLTQLIPGSGPSAPLVWEVYLCEYDALKRNSASEKEGKLSDPDRYQSALNSLAAPARYYFAEFTETTKGITKKRQELKSYYQANPERTIMWDVLYASTFKVRNNSHAQRVYELCRPAIRQKRVTIDDNETADYALLVSLRAAIRVRDIDMLRKSLALLWVQIHDRASDAEYAVMANILVTAPGYDTTEIDDLGQPSTTLYLSRLYRDMWTGKPLSQTVALLEKLLDERGWWSMLGGATVTLSFTSFPGPLPCVAFIDDDLFCDLIRMHQGPVSGLETDDDRRLAALCHAIGGKASAGLGEKEINSDIRLLAESQEKHWAHRGIARRILESDQDHLLPVAMKQLERGYQLCTYRRDQDDPLQLWMCGIGMIEANLGKVLRWVLTLQTGPEFNMALCDIVYPSLSSLCEVEEFESPDDKRNQLLLWVAQSPLLDPANPQTKRLIQALRDIEQPSHAVQLAYKCIDALADKDEAILDLVLTAVDMFPPRQALEIIEPYETLLQSDRAKKVFAEQKAYVEGELRDADRTVPSHWAMFDPAEPTQGRPDLYDQDAQLVVELGATVTFLASPTGQSLLPFSQTKTLFGPRENEWPLTLKRLIQSRLLQVRRESPEGSFEMHEDKRFSWVPAHVELAVNLDSDDSQSGIILGLQNEIQEYVLHSTPDALLHVWQHLVSIEAHDYWISCLEYFRLPTHTLEDDEAHFQSAAALFSLSELMNLIYNVCQSAAGEQKARMLPNTHARNLAGSMLRSRMERAQAEGWTIKRGFRGELMPMSHLIQFFFTDFIPIGQETYECVVPNTGTLADAQEAMNQPQRGPSEPRV